MKTPLWVIAAATLFTAPLLAQQEPSVISEYGGRYSGPVTLSASGSSLSGTTQGSFKTSKTKEIGTLNLVSTFVSAGNSVVVTHRLSFNRRRMQYLLSSQFLTLPGSGTVRVKARVIRYRGTIDIGGTAAAINGTIRRTSKRLLVNDVISTSGGSQTLAYNLRSHRN
jgi:hypothetical protein